MCCCDSRCFSASSGTPTSPRRRSTRSGPSPSAIRRDSDSCSVAEWREGQPKEIVITGKTDDASFRALRRVAGEEFLPHRVLVAGEASNDLPLLQNRPHNKVLAYVCEGYACLDPTSEPQRLRELL